MASLWRCFWMTGHWRGWLIQTEFAAGNKKILQNTGFEWCLHRVESEYSTLSIKISDRKAFTVKQKLWDMAQRKWRFHEMTILLNDFFFQNQGLEKVWEDSMRISFNARSFGFFNLEQRLFLKGALTWWFCGWRNPYFADPMDYPVSHFGAGLNLRRVQGFSALFMGGI
jgi:hypothetical protein